MNKKLGLIVIIGSLLIIGALWYVSMQSPQTQSSQSVPTNNTSNSPQPTPQTPKYTPGQYIDYDSAKIASTSGTKLLFFHAPWCPQCRQLESDIKKGPIPTNVTIFKVDYDNNQALRQKYGVTLQTTIVKVDDVGNEIKKFVAYNEPTLQALVANILQ